LQHIPQTLGFIGAGRMATALGRGCVISGLVTGQQVLAADPSDEARQHFAEQIPGARMLEGSEPLLAEADIVVLAVKPQMMPTVLAELAPHATDSHVFVSVAAGVTLAKLGDLLPKGKLVRVMPNTPCLISKGASCYSLGRGAGAVESKLVLQMLSSVGTATEVDESLLDAVTGLSGSGPAFVYTMIEALAAGGAEMGLPAELALDLATQTALGATEMLLSTGKSPAELRNQVTSPGGTTLAGLEKLAELDGDKAISAAVCAAANRSKELGSE